eukprot:1375319-Amorphochlora_amoeboformis.AAC.1
MRVWMRMCVMNEGFSRFANGVSNARELTHHPVKTLVGFTTVIPVVAINSTFVNNFGNLGCSVDYRINVVDSSLTRINAFECKSQFNT